MRPTALLVLATCLASPPRGAAQQPGARVRLTLTSPSPRRLVGTLIGQEADSLRVRVAGQPGPLSVPRSAVVLEVSAGRRRQVGEGARIGAGLGLLGGVVVSSVAGPNSQSCSAHDAFHLCALDSYVRALRGGVIGGVIGAALGAALGYAVRTDRWEVVALSPDHHLTLAPRGPGVALSLTF